MESSERPPHRAELPLGNTQFPMPAREARMRQKASRFPAVESVRVDKQVVDPGPMPNSGVRPNRQIAGIGFLVSAVRRKPFLPFLPTTKSLCRFLLEDNRPRTLVPLHWPHSRIPSLLDDRKGKPAGAPPADCALPRSVRPKSLWRTTEGILHAYPFGTTPRSLGHFRSSTIPLSIPQLIFRGDLFADLLQTSVIVMPHIYVRLAQLLTYFQQGIPLEEMESKGF